MQGNCTRFKSAHSASHLPNIGMVSLLFPPASSSSTLSSFGAPRCSSVLSIAHSILAFASSAFFIFSNQNYNSQSQVGNVYDTIQASEETAREVGRRCKRAVQRTREMILHTSNPTALIAQCANLSVSTCLPLR